MIQFFKKYHKWLGLFASLFLLVFAISGIVLNHRALLAPVDASRAWMPEEYQYKNWNNAALRSAINISSDSVLLYGNMGIWLSDAEFNHFTDYSNGFPDGIDHKKIDILFKDSQSRIFAGSLFGLYQLDKKQHKWTKIILTEIHNPRIVDLIEVNQELWILTRSEILRTSDLLSFERFELPAPLGYNHKVGLFKTLWLIHSGEIYGFVGKLLVDLVGLIFIFLTLTGLFYFFNARRLKSRKAKDPKALKKRNRFYLLWHNKIGWISLLLLFITTFTGMFLRPPLLIPIAYSKVDKIPFTLLDTPNPWFDQLRKIQFDAHKTRFTIATIEGVFYSDDQFASALKPYNNQPPISVMGVNAFEPMFGHYFLVGSFEGLFLWNTETGEIYDYIKQEPYIKPEVQGPPIGDYMIAGYFKDQNNQELIFDFNQGLLNDSLMAKMPETIIDASPISLWNMAVEYHTGRIYKPFLGPFYILIVPLIGLFGLFILISGFIVWWKRYKNNTD